MARIKDLDRLQPEFRAKVDQLMAALSGSPHKWRVFETLRPASSKCGVANAATSKTDPCVNPTRHAYGAAVDIVPHGHWSGPWKKASWPGWAELRKAAHAVGLDNDIAWDRPHVEVKRSQIAKWLQQDLGVTADGIWGPQSEQAAKAKAAELGIQWRQPIPQTTPRVHWQTYNELRDAMRGNFTGKAIVGGSFVAILAVAGLLLFRGRLA